MLQIRFRSFSNQSPSTQGHQRCQRWRLPTYYPDFPYFVHLRFCLRTTLGLRCPSPQEYDSDHRALPLQSWFIDLCRRSDGRNQRRCQRSGSQGYKGHNLECCQAFSHRNPLRDSSRFYSHVSCGTENLRRIRVDHLQAHQCGFEDEEAVPSISGTLNSLNSDCPTH